MIEWPNPSDYYARSAARQKEAESSRMGCVIQGTIAVVVSAFSIPILGWHFITLLAVWLVGLTIWRQTRLQAITAAGKADELHFAEATEAFQEQESQEQTTLIEKAIEEHLKTLRIKRSQLLRHDEYGKADRTEWEKHCEYFLQRVALEGRQLDHLGVWSGISAIEEALNRDTPDRPPLGNIDVDGLSGLEYEVHCKELLEKCGWTVTVTKASQDQGVDLIATYRSHRVVLQCKRYTKAVGNSAVQEVIAAKTFERADDAVVVSNAPFTKSARTLASSASVYLLHQSELEDLIDLLELDENPAVDG